MLVFLQSISSNSRYIRVSTQHQGGGIATQLEACQEHAHKLGIREQVVFIDTRTHHATPLHSRSGLSKAFTTLSAEDTFIAFNQDRISRDISLITQFNYLIKHIKTQLAYVTVNNYHKHHKVMKLRTECEIEYANTQTRQALRQKKVSGQVFGIVPYGFKLAYDKITLELAEDEQKAIEFIKGLKSSGYSLRAIVNYLLLKGFKDRNGTPFQLTQIARIAKHTTLTNVSKKTRNLAYGFKYTSDGTKVELCPQEQKIIAIILALRNQLLSIRAIVQHINALGFRSRTGNVFGIKQIFTIIKRATSDTKKVTKNNKISLEEATDYVRSLRAQGYSLNAIAFELNTQKLFNNYGKLFSKSHIAKMVKGIACTVLKKVVGKNHVPYGFKYGNNNSIEPCFYEQEIISVVRELAAKGLSYNTIAQELNKRGYKSRAHTAFNVAQVARIVKKHKDKEETFLPIKEVTYEYTPTTV